MKYVILSHFNVYNYYYNIVLVELIPANRNEHRTFRIDIELVEGDNVGRKIL